MLYEVIHSWQGIAVELQYLVQPPEVIAKASVKLGHDDDGVGPGASGFLNHALL